MRTCTTCGAEILTRDPFGRGDPRLFLCRDCRYEIECAAAELSLGVGRERSPRTEAKRWKDIELPLRRSRLRPADWRDW